MNYYGVLPSSAFLILNEIDSIFHQHSQHSQGDQIIECLDVEFVHVALENKRGKERFALLMPGNKTP